MLKLHLFSDPDGSHTHTGTDTHTRDTNLLAAPPQLVEQCANLSGTGAAERVTKGNGTTLGVDLVHVEAELVGAPEALAGKGLVDLKDVDVVLCDAGLFKDEGDGGPGADAHEQGLDADDGGGDVLAQDGLAEALGRGALHHEDGGGAIRDLRGVAGVDGAALGKGALHLAERLLGHARAHAVVLGDGDRLGLPGLGVLDLDRQGVDLLVKEAGLLGLGGLGVRRRGKGVLVGAADVTVRGHLLRQYTHGHLAVGRLGVRLEELRELTYGSGTS